MLRFAIALCCSGCFVQVGQRYSLTNDARDTSTFVLVGFGGTITDGRTMIGAHVGVGAAAECNVLPSDSSQHTEGQLGLGGQLGYSFVSSQGRYHDATSTRFVAVDVGLDTMLRETHQSHSTCPDTIDTSVGLSAGRYTNSEFASRNKEPVYALSGRVALLAGYGGAGLGGYVGWAASVATTFIVEDVLRAAN